ncbi:hypothetical protein DB345_10770 [Spartobacteria bacterium LR76]|nr:hypothetical protein DB345_10770 [Spartobacteria bacterium LR76]
MRRESRAFPPGKTSRLQFRVLADSIRLMSDSTVSSPVQALSKSRGWLIFAGFLSVFVGFFAMGSPFLFSIVLAQFLAAFILISGCISLGLVIFGKHVAHRVLDGFLALLRIAAGIVLLACVASSVAVITLILAVFLIIEGVSVIIGAFKMRQHAGWVWTLISGIAALVLGVMVYSRWPNDSTWVIGLFYGINSLFWGVSLLSMGFAAPKTASV